MAFTTREISNYLKYEKVRSGGHYNMFDKDAHKATELETDDYNFVMRNYYDLSSQAKHQHRNLNLCKWHSLCCLPVTN